MSDLITMQERQDLNHHLSILLQADAFSSFGDAKRTKVVGITKLVIDRGEHCLSSRQAHVFKNEVIKRFCRPTCWRCGEIIPLDQAWDYEEDGLADLCESCRHDWHRLQ